MLKYLVSKKYTENGNQLFKPSDMGLVNRGGKLNILMGAEFDFPIGHKKTYINSSSFFSFFN